MKQNEERKTPKKLVIEIPEDIHQKIKMRALERNVSLKVWVLMAISGLIKFEDQYK